MTHTLLPRIASAGIIATLRAPSAPAALAAVDALVAGGITAVEITYTTPDAGAVIAEVVRRHGDSVVVGAGTLLHARQVREAADGGAEFFVSPGYDGDVVESIQRTGGLSMIGGFTPTEVQRLAVVGVDVVKLFPGSLGGPGLLKALRGPFPELRYVPTGGVSATNLREWFDAGATAVGAGSELIPAAALAAGDHAAIEAMARTFVSALRS